MAPTLIYAKKNIENIRIFLQNYYFSRFKAYFTDCRQLCQENSPYLRRLAVSKIILKMGALYGLMFALYQDTMSPPLNATLHNGLFLENLPGVFNIFTFVFFLFSHALLNLMYSRKPVLCHQIIEQLLIYGRSDSFFLWGTVNWGSLPGGKLISRYFGEAFLKRSLTLSEKSIVVYFGKLAILTRCISSVTYLALAAFEGVITWEAYLVLCEYSIFDSEKAYLYLVASILMTVVHIICFSMMMHPFVLTSNLTILVLTAFTIRLWQMEQLVRPNSQNKVQHFTGRFLYQFQLLTIQSLSYIQSVNTIYGQALLLVLLVGLPTSAIFIMVLSTYSIEIIFKVAILLAVGFSLFLMFILHYYIVKLSCKMHKPAKYLLSANCQRQSSVNNRDKLRLANYLEQFHTTKSYTSYGPYGSCTLVSLQKFLFYYVKLIFMSYNFIVLMGKAKQ